MDFGALPPEINSGRMYSGPGAGPMLAAAAAWDGLAAELSSTASSYDSVISGLAGEAWSGPSAASMTAAATPFASWMSSTAGYAEQTAVQARAAAAAYDAAFSATVPPPVIAANRSLLMSLIATNILGQNTAAIAATEAHYAEMWAQDALAMYGYAGASANATVLPPFSTPPRTANPAGLTSQVAAASHSAALAGSQAPTTLTQLMSMVPSALQSLATSGAVNAAQAEPPLLAFLDFIAGPLSPISLFGIGGIPYLLAIQAVLLPMNGSNVVAAVVRAEKMAAAGEWVPPLAGLDAEPRLVSLPTPGGAAVSAGIGNASSVGRLSVPSGWAAATPAAESVTTVPPSAGPGAAPMLTADSGNGLVSNLALGGLAGRAIGATGGAASRAAGTVTDAAKSSKPTKATIIVIPPSAED